MDYEAENISCLRFSDKDPIFLRALTAVLAHTGQIRNWQLFFWIDKIGRPHAQHKNNIGHFLIIVTKSLKMAPITVVQVASKLFKDGYISNPLNGMV